VEEEEELSIGLCIVLVVEEEMDSKQAEVEVRLLELVDSITVMRSLLDGLEVMWAMLHEGLLLERVAEEEVVHGSMEVMVIPMELEHMEALVIDQVLCL
jgi:hypothetical protein